MSTYEPLNPNRIHLTILCMCPGVGLREFAFDGVFGPKVKKGVVARTLRVFDLDDVVIITCLV